MQISNLLASNIVNEMKMILNHEINFMSTESIIIASTDSSRIGNSHEGSKVVLRTGKELIVEYDSEFVGTKRGINVPIYFEKSIIGVIGITGNKDDVIKYSSIIKKMTEILIKEQYIKNITFNKRESFNLTIDSLLKPDMEFNHSTSQNSQLIFKKNKVKIGIIGKIEHSVYDYDSHTLFNLLEYSFKNDNETIFSIKRNYIYIVSNYKTKKDLLSKLNKLKDNFNQRVKTDIMFGIGDISKSTTELVSSLKNANEALQWAIQYTNNSYTFSDELDVALILNHTPRSYLQNYKKRILSSIPGQEFEELKSIFLKYGESDRSISATADYFYLHKNTVQYKLNKIKQYTDYNPRVLNEYVILYLAFLITDITTSDT